MHLQQMSSAYLMGAMPQRLSHTLQPAFVSIHISINMPDLCFLEYFGDPNVVSAPKYIPVSISANTRKSFSLVIRDLTFQVISRLSSKA